MIRIALPVGQSLEDVVDAFDPTWRGKNVVWDGKNSPWSDIKEVFVGLQLGKCADCERLVQADLNENKVESDVEHYRPKKKTTAWVSRDTKVKTGRSAGYVWLAVNVGNYLLSCKTCNTTHKKNGFPIAGLVGQERQSIAALNAREKPFLLYPIGDFDDDPEDLIDWEGFVPVPKITESDDAFRFHRAQVNIEFFKLDQRHDVRRGCAEQICMVWDKFLLMLNVPAEAAEARAFLEDYKTNSMYTHVACIRAFLRLIATDAVKAKQVVLAAKKYLAETPGRFQT
jgi:hypothetical protein